MSRNSQDVALLSPDERDLKPDDLEAGKSHGDSKDQNLDHEYSIPSAVKFTWLGTYFFFSLVLTLYNKLVLGKVRLCFRSRRLSLESIRPSFPTIYSSC